MPRGVGHPAPFPVELPLRLIELFTYEGDLVLDPFMGSGTTAAAAVRSRRHYVGYDTESEYVRIAEQRVSEERDRIIEREERSFEQARRDGSGARELAGELLRRCGFIDVAPSKRPVAGVEIAYTGRDRTGRQWLFDISGAFTTTNAGLRRSDALWRALGKAAVIHAAWPEVPFVLLTTAAPAPASAGDRAWRSLGEAAPPGEIGAVYDVVELGSPEGEARLSRYASEGLRPGRETPRARRTDVPKTRRGAPRAR